MPLSWQSSSNGVSSFQKVTGPVKETEKVGELLGSLHSQIWGHRVSLKVDDVHPSVRMQEISSFHEFLFRPISEKPGAKSGWPIGMGEHPPVRFAAELPNGK